MNTKSGFFKKYLSISTLLICGNYGCLAQSDTTVTRVNQLSLSVLFPALKYTYENKICSQSVYEIQAGILGGFHERRFGEFRESRYIFNPMFNISYKNYYNLQKRASKGKNTRNNSANFFGLSVINMIGEYQLGILRLNGAKYKNDIYTSIYQLGIVPSWGMNRRAFDKCSFFLQIGPSLITNLKDVKAGLYSNVGFAYTFK